jgi:hypothetical protein
VQEAGGQVEAPLHPAGVGLHGVAGAIGQADDVQHLVNALGQLPPPQAIDLPEEDQVVAAGDGGVEGQVLGHHADDLLDLGSVLDHVVAGDGHRPLGGREEAGEHRDEGGLPRPVGPQQAEDLAFLDGEADPIYRGEVPVFLHQVLNLNDSVHHFISSLQFKSDLVSSIS